MFDGPCYGASVDTGVDDDTGVEFVISAYVSAVELCNRAVYTDGTWKRIEQCASNPPPRSPSCSYDGNILTEGTWDVVCEQDSDCDDGAFCNGAEMCVEGSCAAGSSPCSEGQVCDEDNDRCELLKGVLDTGDPNERVCNPKSYTDLGNGIVRDNVTELEWVQDGNVMADRDPDFDNDGTAGDGRVTWQHALDYVALLNVGEYLGHDDWRLPTIEELSTLVDAGRSMPAIDPIFSAVPFEYWSSTTNERDTRLRVVFEFLGSVAYKTKIKAAPFTCALCGVDRMGAFNNFVVNGDGTVTDTNTALMWQQCNDGQTLNGNECIGSPATPTWYQAVAYVQELNDTGYLGYDDWRLPTISELQSLVDYSRNSPATAFPNTVQLYYWSYTAFALRIDGAWTVSFAATAL